MTTKEKNQALVYALKLLGMRMHSEKELLKKLYAKKFPPAEIYALIEKLKERKLIDDSVFTRAYVDQLRNKATGDVRIRFQLKKKGLGEKIIEECFDKENREDQRKRALDLASLKIKPDKSADPKERKRIYDYLTRKGFDYEICRDVMGQLMKTKDDLAWD
ncbi:MAG: regulatory protein RecX [Candidatus Omnitrophica bacterium]|nr:regulatory protein RecX [Candidatus Omnitrophota bacterium]